MEVGDEADEEMEGREEEAYLLLSSSPPAPRGRQRRRQPSAGGKRRARVGGVPSVRRSRSIFGWIGVDWVGAKTNPKVVKCIRACSAAGGQILRLINYLPGWVNPLLPPNAYVV
jgi:hypothetical protein